MPQRTLSLRTLMTIPFLLLFVTAAGGIGWTSFINASRATEKLAAQYSEELGARIESHLRQLFATPVIVAQANRDALLHRWLDIDDIDSLSAHLIHQIRYLPHLTFNSFAFSNGRYIAATRTPGVDAEPHILANVDKEPFNIAPFRAAPDGSKAEQLAQKTAYDPRERFFMTHGATQQQPFWYPVYRYRAYDSLGIGIAAPIHDQDGNFIGVAAADLALERISQFLRSLRIGQQGIAFVAEPDGMLLATSSAQPVYSTNDQGQLQRQHLRDQLHPVLSAAGHALPAGAKAGTIPLRVAGEDYLFQLNMFRDEHGLELLSGILLPESEFTATVRDSARLALALTLLAIVVGTAIGLLLARWIARPVERISEQAQRLALGELQHSLDQNSPIREVNQLATSFSKMATDLRKLIDTLESRVAARTNELQVANAELKRISNLDGLTGIANRRHFDQQMQQEWQRARRESKPVTLIFCDVDEFKTFNDNYGHQRGDDALREVAHSLKQCLRRTGDLAARYGGEEFVLLLPDTDLAGGQQVALAMQRQLHQQNVARDDSALSDRLTLSIGIACQVPDRTSQPEQLVEQADHCMYQAKSSGRNRIVPSPE